MHTYYLVARLEQRVLGSRDLLVASPTLLRALVALGLDLHLPREVLLQLAIDSVLVALLQPAVCLWVLGLGTDPCKSRQDVCVLVNTRCGDEL